MKRIIKTVLFFCLTISLISCNLFSTEKSSDCDHDWEVELLGGG